MISKHRLVYEVNPNNYKEKVRLSLKNLKSENFKAEGTNNAPTTSTIAIVKNALENDDMIVPVEKSPSRPVSDFTKK